MINMIKSGTTDSDTKLKMIFFNSAPAGNGLPRLAGSGLDTCKAIAFLCSCSGWGNQETHSPYWRAWRSTVTGRD